MYNIEWQKRGLPHVHLLAWNAAEKKKGYRKRNTCAVCISFAANSERQSFVHCNVLARTDIMVPGAKRGRVTSKIYKTKKKTKLQWKDHHLRPLRNSRRVDPPERSWALFSGILKRTGQWRCARSSTAGRPRLGVRHAHESLTSPTHRSVRLYLHILYGLHLSPNARSESLVPTTDKKEDNSPPIIQIDGSDCSHIGPVSAGRDRFKTQALDTATPKPQIPGSKLTGQSVRT
ncbi:hypothetical protein EVAR_59426_1 [Eumeta japonica]|uniref:Helitron helicase-like domain-containing protein n=1 Tax=Eumeta variegata TaxID=151549 RepID=A0A4C1ZSJ7_EUMVA|nr:hypothetical protein EVAR_59426_1 [Eumeta japonica]